MSHPVISVENLSKAYRIGLKEEIPDSLVGAVTSWARAPLANLRKLRRLDTAGADGDSADTLWALRDVSFDVREGEVVGIIGRNGAGKSTLLKILSRITEPTSGRAIIRGRVSSLLEVGTGFHPELTGRENIYMNGTILGMRKKEIDRKFDEIVDFSGVEKFLDTPIKRYSSGMQVRLAFAVAAHLEPEILIIDEVLAVGDAEFQKKCIGKMRNVAEGGRTVLFVSHNMAAIGSLCQTASLLDFGRISFCGAIEDALRHFRGLMIRGDRAQGVTRISSVIRRVELLSTSSSFVELGQSLILDIECDFPNSTCSPTIGIGIDNAWGQRVLSLHTHRTAPLPERMAGLSRIRVTVPQCPLAPGEYTIRIVISSRNGHVDTLDNAFCFSVIDADAFGEGRGFHKGYCVAASKWQILLPDTFDDCKAHGNSFASTR